MSESNSKRRHHSFSISQKSEVPAVREEIAAQLLNLGYGERDRFAIRLATEEALLNAIEHGNKCDKRKKVAVTCRLNPKKAEITVTDEGDGFDPNCIPDCTAADNLAKPRGRGIALMRGFMDTVKFNRKGNRLRLVKFKSVQNRPESAAAST